MARLAKRLGITPVSANERINLLAAQGLSNDQIAESLSVPRQIVSKWRKRFFEERLAGLVDEPRTGRPPVFPPRSGRAG